MIATSAGNIYRDIRIMIFEAVEYTFFIEIFIQNIKRSIFSFCHKVVKLI
ncbi:MAG: hypothetical protein MJZ90_04900 [Bacteroidales bacterium]|nr:hypothetical protein [Bacteroidales bacterium]